MSREYTVDEVRKQFLDHILDLIDYWENEKRAPTSREKLEGFAHSLLVTLDGGSGSMPGFVVTAQAHELDKDYHISQEENWYPKPSLDNDIAGSLHEHFGQRESVQPVRE